MVIAKAICPEDNVLPIAEAKESNISRTWLLVQVVLSIFNLNGFVERFILGSNVLKQRRPVNTE
jgi:hypothetical protein